MRDVFGLYCHWHDRTDKTLPTPSFSLTALVINHNSYSLTDIKLHSVSTLNGTTSSATRQCVPLWPGPMSSSDKTDYFTKFNFPPKLLPSSGCYLPAKIIIFVGKLIWTRILNFTKICQLQRFKFYCVSQAQLITVPTIYLLNRQHASRETRGERRNGIPPLPSRQEFTAGWVHTWS